MTDLLLLAERVEGATGPDTELDALVTVATRNEPTARILYAKGRRWFYAPGKGRLAFAVAFGSGTKFGLLYQQLRFTASLNAAKTLLPEGALWAVGHMEDGPFARLLWPNPNGTYTGNYVETNAATAENALLASILRARHTMEGLS